MDSQRGKESAIELYKDPEFGTMLTRYSLRPVISYNSVQIHFFRSKVIFEVKFHRASFL